MRPYDRRWRNLHYRSSFKAFGKRITTMSTTSSAGALADSSPHDRLARLMDGYLVTQALYVAMELGIADRLADGPRTADDLAAEADADPGALHRVLRLLAAEGILVESDGGFGLTPLGELLRADVPGSHRGACLARGTVYYEAAGGLLRAVREGGAAFVYVHGQSLIDYLGERPALGAAFQGSMTARSTQEAAAVVAAYDFSAYRRLVDVGGGTGVLLAAILTDTPWLHGVLFDRPQVIEAAGRRLAEAGLAERSETVGGDFFDAVPAGADAYLLSRVIHDWNDDDAVRILGVCRRAMGEQGRLLLVEALLPERATEQPAAIRMDIHMLVLLHGRERTEAEFAGLLARAGFRVTRVVPTDSPAGIAVIEAVPA